MPRLPVDLDPSAIAEARAAREWYAQRSSAAANRFIEELDVAIDTIATDPESCPSYIDDTRRYLFRRLPYYVVFRRAGASIQVVAIAHGRRRPGYWRAR